MNDINYDPSICRNVMVDLRFIYYRQICRENSSNKGDKASISREVFKGGNGNETYDGLYVVDGSIIPSPLGVNPSLTIAALSFRIALNIVADKHFLTN